MEYQVENIKNFLRTAYDDAHLLELREHVRAGRFSYFSCCCLVGGASAPHPLRTQYNQGTFHYIEAMRLPFAREAQYECSQIGRWLDNGEAVPTGDSDRERCRVLLPLIEQEMEHRALNIVEPLVTVPAHDLMVL